MCTSKLFIHFHLSKSIFIWNLIFFTSRGWPGKTLVRFQGLDMFVLLAPTTEWHTLRTAAEKKFGGESKQFWQAYQLCHLSSRPSSHLLTWHGRSFNLNPASWADEATQVCTGRCCLDPDGHLWRHRCYSGHRMHQLTVAQRSTRALPYFNFYSFL